MSRQRSWAVCLVAIVTAGLTGLACQSAVAQSTTPAPVLKPVFVILTSAASDTLRCMMALGLAGSAVDAGRNVAIYLDVNAPELARKDKSAKPFVANRRRAAAKGMDAIASLQKTMNALMAKGAKVYVCPMCMKTLKITQESLLDGITILTDRELLDTTSGATVLSY
jgi:predicted peroxiredoxin